MNTLGLEQPLILSFAADLEDPGLTTKGYSGLTGLPNKVNYLRTSKKYRNLS
jgi:hypothetical protein